MKITTKNIVTKLLYYFCFVLPLFCLSCERASKDTSTVSLLLPTEKTSQSVSSLTCTKCLKAVAVNVDGEGIANTVKYFSKIDFDNSLAELGGEVALEVPAGSKRRIQVLAVYRNSDNSKEVQFGSVVVDLLESEPPPINVSLANLGVFKGGSLVGRYLTSTNAGPTGKVLISFKHASSGLNMQLFESEILNGWFDFFISENFLTSYKLVETGQFLFEDVTLDSLTPAAAVDHIARVSRPSGPHYSTRDGWTTNELINEYHDILYGFFGAAALVSGKTVCLEHNPSSPGSMTFTQLSTTPNGSGPITYHHNDASADVNGFSGRSSIEGPCSGSTTDVRYQPNRISVNKSQFDGQGNDTAKSINGAFSFMSVSTNIRKYDHLSSPYYFKGLPSLFAPTGSGAMFDGVRLFNKANSANSGFDEAKCSAEWMAANGFVEVPASSFTTVPYVPSADNITFQLVSPVNGTDGYIICPTNAGQLTGFGAAYLGSMQ